MRSIICNTFDRHKKLFDKHNALLYILTQQCAQRAAEKDGQCRRYSPA